MKLEVSNLSVKQIGMSGNGMSGNGMSGNGFDTKEMQLNIEEIIKELNKK